MDNNTLEYIRLVYGKDSTFRSIVDINERKQVVSTKLKMAIPDAKDFGQQVIRFMREENKFAIALLDSKQELFWETMEIMREPLTVTKDDDKRLKNIKLKGDVNDLCSKLSLEIDRLAATIYGEEHKEEAMRVVVSPEERLLKKKTG